MPALFSTFLGWVMVSNFAKIFVGLGIALTAQVFLTDYINDLLLAIVGTVNTAASDVANLFMLMGFGSFLSIVGSAMLTRVTIVQASRIAGITKST